MAERNYPSPKVRGGDHKCQAVRAQERPKGGTPHPRSGAAAETTMEKRGRDRPHRSMAERSYPSPEVRGGSREELLHVPRSGVVPGQTTPHLMSGMAAEMSYPMPEVRGGPEEIPLVQGKEQRLRSAGTAVKRYPMSKVRETQVRR